MQIDLVEQTAPRREQRNRPGRAWLPLLSALLKLAQGKGELISHSERAWASVTFAGARHTVVLGFCGADAVSAGEALIDALPDHEFTIPGQLVADAAVVAVRHIAVLEPRLELTLEVLMLEES